MADCRANSLDPDQVADKEQFDVGLLCMLAVKVYGYLSNLFKKGNNFCDFMHLRLIYRKNSKIWDTSNNCHNCPRNRKILCNIA